MKVKWHCETNMQGCDQHGEVEVDDDATDEEIEVIVREDVFNSWTWEKA